MARTNPADDTPGPLPPRQVAQRLLLPLAISLMALAHVATTLWWVSPVFGSTPGDGGPIIGLDGLLILLGGGLAMGAVVLTALLTIGLSFAAYRSRGALSRIVMLLCVVLGGVDLLACGGYGLLALGELADAGYGEARARAHANWVAETQPETYRSDALGVSFSFLPTLPPREYQRPRVVVREADGHVVIVGEREEGPLSVYARLTVLDVPEGTSVLAYLQSLTDGDGCDVDDVSSESWREGPIRALALRHQVYGMYLSPDYGCRMPQLPTGPLFGGPIPFEMAQLEGRFSEDPPAVSEESRNIYFVVEGDRVWAGLFDGDERPLGPGALLDPVDEEERWWAGTLRFDAG